MLMLMLMLTVIPIAIEFAKDRKDDDDDDDDDDDGVMLVTKGQVEVSGCGFLGMMTGLLLLELVPLNKLIVFGID